MERWGEQFNNLLDDILMVEEYIAMKLTGLADIRIAMDLHIGLHTLNRWKSKKNINRNVINSHRYILIKDYLSKNFTMEQISIRLSLSARQCYNIIKENDSWKSQNESN